MTLARTVNEITVTELCSAALYVMDTVIREAQESLENDPETALEEILIGARRKAALRIDASAEEAFGKYLRRYHDKRFASVELHGEEALRNPKLDLSEKRGIIALVDAIDGTDLLERGLWNWCSAAVFFNPSRDKGSRILASCVGLPSGEVYYARQDRDGAYVKQGKHGVEHGTSGPSKVRSLRTASVCFYGQKAANFLSLAGHPLLQKVNDASHPGKKAAFRIYNLAGNPMMVKLVDHRVKVAHCIDVVLDVKGQKPHDVVPGAYIAKKAGAILTDLSGRDIEYSALENSLLRPSEGELTYILSSTRQLCNEIHPLLDERTRTLSAKVWDGFRRSD